MVTQQYRTNLNCGKCVAAVTPYLENDPDIQEWSVDTNDSRKILTIRGNRIDTPAIEKHIADAGFRVLGIIDGDTDETAGNDTDHRSFLQIYRPLLLVLAYLIGIVALAEWQAGALEMPRAMRRFMGGFFIAFSFFKLLDLRGFVDSFQTYDVLARASRSYGVLYPFLELTLGIAYLVNFQPIIVNGVTLAVMLLGLIGVTQALLQKRQIQCACLGTVFNLPMSQVTFIENGTMAVMAAWMLLQQFA